MSQQFKTINDPIAIAKRTKPILKNDLLKPIIDEAYKYAGLTPPNTIIKVDSPYVGNWVQVVLQLSFNLAELTEMKDPSKIIYSRVVLKTKLIKLENPTLPKKFTLEFKKQRELQMKAMEIASEYLYNRLSELEKQHISKIKFIKQSYEFLRNLLVSTPKETLLKLSDSTSYGNFQEYYIEGNPISTLDKECHIYWPFDDVFIVSDFPKTFSFTQVVYRDGYINTCK